MSSLGLVLRSSFLASRASSITFAAALLAAGSSGCVHAYDGPRDSEPHASLEIRRVYANARGSHLRETVTLEKRVALSTVDRLDRLDRLDPMAAVAPRVDGLLAHPVPAEMAVSVETFHRELRTSDEYVTEDVPYRETETFPCGSASAPATCSRTVVKHRQETRLRPVERMVEIRDGACVAKQWIAPRPDARMLIDFDYEGNGICQLTCNEVVTGAAASAAPSAASEASANASATLKPCVPPSREDVERAIAAR